MIREYRERLRQTQADIESQAKVQEESLSSQAEEQRAKLAQQVEEAESGVRRDIGEFEKERQALAQQIRSKERLEERKGAVGEYTPTDTHTEEQLGKLEHVASEVLGRSSVAREDIAKQQKEALANIDKALENAIKEVRSEKSKLMSDAREQYQRLSDEFERENIEIAPDKWVNRAQWEKFKEENIEVSTDKWMDRKEWEKLTPEQQFEVQTTGKYTIQKTETEIKYPPTGQAALQQLIESGEAPKNSIVVSYDRNTGELKYKEPDIEIPIIDSGEVISEIENEPELQQEPELQTKTITTTVIEVDTPTGKVQYKPEDWEGLPDTKKLEVSLGRPPTMAEYQAYHLQKYLIDKGYVTEHDVEEFYGAINGSQIPIISGIKHGVEYFRARIQSLIPDWQKGELILNELNGAQNEWEWAYPDMAATGEMAEVLTGLGFPVAKVLYPQITKKDITTTEWVESGVSAVLWTSPLWLPRVTEMVKTPLAERLASITPERLKTEFQRTYSVAKNAGNAKSAMEKAISKLESTQITDPNYARVASNAQRAIQDSISADLKFIERYSSLDSVNLKEVARFEKASKMEGLTQATRDVINKRQAYEALLKKVESDALIQDVKLRNRITNARAEFTLALDKFEVIAQPRSGYWRVPSPEKVVQTGLDVKITEKPVNPEFQRLLDSIYDYQLEHPIVSPESKGGVATALKPQRLIAKPETKIEIKPKFKVEPTEGIKTKVEATVPKAAEAKPTPAPTPPIPSETTTRTRVREPQYEPRVQEERLGAMTPEQAQRYRETEETVTEVIGKPIEGATTLTTVSPTTTTRIREITQAATGYAYQLKNLGWTDAQIASQVKQYIENKVALEVYPETKTQLRQQVETMTETALKTTTKVEIGTKVATDITTKTTPVIPPAIPSGKAKKWTGATPPPATVVWTMGFPRGHEQGMWNILPPPYDQLYYDKVIPTGAVIKARGRGSAKANLQMVGGLPSEDINKTVDIGATLLTIRVEKGTPRLSFRRDPADAYKGEPEITTPTHTPISTSIQTPKVEKGYQLVQGYVRKKKPSEKDWWENEYYETPKPPQKIERSAPQRTYFGHRILDIPALTGKELD